MDKKFTEKAAVELKKALEKYAADAVLQKGISKENGTFEVVISTEHVDRDGEIVKQDGLDTKNFMKNPTVLFGHRHRELPIGKVTKIRREGKKTIAEGVFASAAANPLAQQVRNLHDEGIIKTVSIGFMIRERDEQKRNILTETELLEISFVPIPSNIHAVSILKKAGIKDFDFKLMDVKDVDDVEEPEVPETVEDPEESETPETPEVPEVPEEKKDVKNDDDEEVEEVEEDDEKSFNQTETSFRVTVREAKEFQENTMRTIDVGDNVKALIGKVNGETKPSLQSFILPKAAEWTEETAKKWASEKKEDVESKNFDFEYLESMILEGKEAIKEVDDKVKTEVNTADEVRKLSKQAMASISQIVEKGAQFYKESRGLDGSDKNKK